MMFYSKQGLRTVVAKQRRLLPNDIIIRKKYNKSRMIDGFVW